MMQKHTWKCIKILLKLEFVYWFSVGNAVCNECSLTSSHVKENPVTLQYYLLSPSFVLSLQDSGRCPEELLNPAEYMSYQRICNMEHIPESQPAAAFPPVTFLPQHPYAQQPASEPMYSNTGFSAPGPRAPFTFPKEQSVWRATLLVALQKGNVPSKASWKTTLLQNGWASIPTLLLFILYA